jgi:biopolymer transport protein TolR
MIRAIETKKKIVSEINITPLVDTLLVLLIIFMVTAPAMTRSIGIQLPKPNMGLLQNGFLKRKRILQS